jgi:predicted nucleotidyltransferase
MIYTIEEIKRRITPVIEKYRIPAMYLFGSYARGEAAEESDIDFLVDTAGTELTSLLRLGALYCDLEEAFHKRIDLITVQSLNQRSTMESDQGFNDTVLQEMIPLRDVV